MVEGSGLLNRRSGDEFGPLVRIQYSPPVLKSEKCSISLVLCGRFQCTLDSESLGGYMIEYL